MLKALALSSCAGALLLHLCPDEYRQTLLVAAMVTLLCASLLSLFKKDSRDEVYGLDHVVLHLQAPSSTWNNMGYWKDAFTLEQACEALATKLGDLAKLEEGDSVLDVGYGCGDSLLHWAEYKPRKIVGITSLPSQQGYATARVQKAYVEQTLPRSAQIDTLLGEAVAWTTAKAQQRPVQRFDKIVALDCAYHFHTRAIFLRNARALLKQVGVLALSDLLLPDRPLTWKDYMFHRVVCYAAGVPWCNMVNEAQYEAMFARAGFKVAVIDDDSSNVFGGLANHIDRTRADLLLRTAVKSGLLTKYVGFARVLRWYARGNMRFVLVKAEPMGTT